MPISSAILEGVKSVQSGVVTMASLTTGSIAITAVVPTKSIVEITGISTFATGPTNESEPTIFVASGTSLTWQRITNTVNGVFTWQVTEYF